MEKLEYLRQFIEYNNEVLKDLDVNDRVEAQIKLKETLGELEQRVEERTLDLKKVNEKLIQEIEGRKQAEVTLKESEEKYRLLFKTARVGLYRTRVKDGKILEANDMIQLSLDRKSVV